MTEHPDAGKWDAKYAASANCGTQPARVLTENLHLLPASGDALDLACGRGANALLLAGRGFRTAAWDISATALRQLDTAAAAAGFCIHTEAVDVTRRTIPAHSLDVIVVSRYLERGIIPALIGALRRGGLIFYQTFVIDSPAPGGPSNPAYRLGPNELLRLFDTLQILVYREEGRAGNPELGFRAEAMLVGRKA